MLQATSTTNSPISEKITLSDSVYALQRKFVTLSYAAQGHSKREHRSWYSAALVFMECFVRDVEPNSVMARRLVQKLRRSIIDLGALKIDRPDPWRSHVWLWCLYVGGMTAVDKPTKEWFVGQILPVCISSQICEWSQMEDALKMVCWSGTRTLAAGRRFWQILQENLEWVDLTD